jgi:hypothetical protein
MLPNRRHPGCCGRENLTFDDDMAMVHEFAWPL